MRRSDLVYYMRSLIGFLVGFLSALLTGLELPPFPWLPGLLLAIAIYPLTYKAFSGFKGLRRREAAILGVEAYIFMWLFSWTLFYTLLGYWA